MSDDAEEWMAPSVPSSMVAAAKAEGGMLIVRFKDGRIYGYPGATGMLDDFLAAESPGKFVHRHLRGRNAVRIK